MKTRKLEFLNWQMSVLTLAVLLAGSYVPAYCEPLATELLIQQSPVYGGTIAPASGLHCFQINSAVALKAVPEPGYQFACWLGDVVDPSSANTTVHLNGPKIIVALFLPVEFDLPLKLGRAFTGGGGGSNRGTMPAAFDFSVPAWSTPSGGPRINSPSNPSVPAESAPVPEPTTSLLMGLGIAALRIRRRQHLPK